MAHVIVFGNEKGGTGKSTLAMHVLVCLLREGRSAGVIDLDTRQRSIGRYLDNRCSYAARVGIELPLPSYAPIGEPAAGELPSGAIAERLLESALGPLRSTVDFIVIDCPGSHSPMARLAHALADTLVTPLNDSFVDLDVLGRIDSRNGRVARLSHYAETVFDSRKFRSASELKPLDWVVTANRIATLNSRNNERVDAALAALQKLLNFRRVPGLSERVIYREMFPDGLTMMDIDAIPGMGLTQISHVAARHEVRELVRNLRLPAASAAAPARHRQEGTSS